MGKRFEDKVAVVTGAANGIGRCIVDRLLEEGAKVAALDIEGDTLAREFEGNEDVTMHVIDVADYTACNKVVEEVLEEYGHIDLLFSNAGIIVRGSAQNTTEEDWRRVIDVNLNGCFWMDQAVAKAMIERGTKGAIVNTSSCTSRTVSKNTGAYAASKAGVAQLTKWLALELAEYGIRVNSVGPGTSMTRITEGTRNDPERNAQFLANIPMGRYGDPREAANVALFLASDEASYVTGETLVEDGGFTLF